MADYPLVRALLREMLDIGDEDTQLPLPILVNLHRRQLRMPLETVAQLPSDSDTKLRDVLAGLYPQVSGEQFQDQELIAIAETRAERFDSRPGGVWRLVEQQSTGQAALRRVIDLAQTDWVAYEPALALYELSLSRLPDGAAEVLEVELDLSPAAHAMLLDLYRRGLSAQTATLET